ncbi:MAG: SPOR domain-containing protein [Roseobacter sp.]
MGSTIITCVSGVPKKKLSAAVLAMFALSACDDSGAFNLEQVFKPKPQSTETAAENATAEFVENDVEAPEVFSATEAGLWDGRPSLGGVWVAHPDVTTPERVMVRNQSNGKFVVGALFRRERDIPGPRLQISSDAAKALDVLAGAPVELDVVALRKERTPITPPDTQASGVAAAETAQIEQTTLDPIIAASAAIDSADPTPVTEGPSTSALQSSLPVSGLEKPFVQVGIYNREDNAERVAKQMRSAGLIPTILTQEANGKNFWRVIVGPATSSSERRKIQDQIKAEGFSDAYAVTN